MKLSDTNSETITLKELAAALLRGCHNISALKLLDDIKAHREPVWVTGDVVKDAQNVLWRRTSGGYWERFGDNRNHRDDDPLRPLVKIGEGLH